MNATSDQKVLVFDFGAQYGQQIMAVTLDGEVGHTEKGGYGPTPLTRTDGGTSALYGDTPAEQTVWMSHRDAVSRAPEGFAVTAKTDVCPVASMECPERKLYATQFHPEVRHTPYGNELLKNFLFGVCGLEANWNMDSIAAIRAQVGGGRVILGESHRQAADLRVRELRACCARTSPKRWRKSSRNSSTSQASRFGWKRASRGTM